MKIIKVTTDNAIEEYPYPDGSIEEENKNLRELIGKECRIFECVHPAGLYSLLGHKRELTNTPGEHIFMLIDEECNIKSKVPPLNKIATFLYNSDFQTPPHPIRGDVLFMGMEYSIDGPRFCGIEDRVYKKLSEQLTYIADRI